MILIILGENYNHAFFFNLLSLHLSSVQIFHELIPLFFLSGVGLSPLYCGHFWPIVPAPDDRWGW
jgi:hypothetical protein